MFVAINLDIPFLWVDRYCIDQENPQEKHDIISNMDRIYNGAQLTIIASVGEDPNHGLPGIRGTPRNVQLKLRGDTTAYVAVENIVQETLDSTWNTRGWTFQVMLLSRRRLVFAKSQIYFQCRQLNALESAPGMLSAAFARDQRIFPTGELYANNTVMLVLADRLGDYFKRQLSFQTDVVDAFLGIANYFGVSQFYGVLVRHMRERTHTSFLQHLLWKASHVDFGRLATEFQPFPSWTWASIQAMQHIDSSPRVLYPRVENSDLQSHFTGITVDVTHKSEGSIGIVDFVYGGDSYKSFEPWIDVTTWIRQCSIDNGKVMDLYDNNITTAHVKEALHGNEMHAICLKVAPLDINLVPTTTVTVEGLWAVQVESNVYRRLDVFSFEIPIRYFSYFVEILRRFGRFDPNIPLKRGQPYLLGRAAGDEVKWKRWLKEHECLGPQILDQLPGKQWQRRKVCLV